MFGKESKKVTKHLEDFSKGSQMHLQVTQGAGILQISVKSGEGTQNIGWNGLIELVNQNEQMGMSREHIFATITVNGVQLNELKVMQFWDQYNQKQ